MTDNTTATDDMRDIEIEIGGKTFRSGTSTGRRLVPKPVSGSETDAHWIEMARRAVRNQTDSPGLVSRLEDYGGDEEGDRVTLGELLDRRGLNCDDLRREHQLDEFDVGDLDVGDVLVIETYGNDGVRDPKQVVVRSVRDGVDGPVATIPQLGSLTHSKPKYGRLYAGPVGHYSTVHDIRKLAPESEEVTEEAREERARLLRNADLDEQAADLSVETKRTWTRSGGEGSDHYAVVSVSGPEIDYEGPVLVELSNLFDAGFVSSIESPDDLDEDSKKLAIRAARNNSPIPTGIRM